MAYDSARIVVADASLLETPDRVVSSKVDFDRSERIALLVGGAGLGATAGFSLAMVLGYLSLVSIVLIAAPALVLALHHLTHFDGSHFLRAYGCATATVLHGAALLSWPMAALMAPLSPVNFWMAPVVAGSALIMFASCWQGPPRAIYRLSFQALLVGAVTAHQGLMLLMGA